MHKEASCKRYLSALQVLLLSLLLVISTATTAAASSSGPHAAGETCSTPAKEANICNDASGPEPASPLKMSSSPSSSSSSTGGSDEAGTTKLAPVVFLSHGGGPCFFLPNDGMFGGLGIGSPMEQWYRNEAPALFGPKEDLKAILVISAHWESDGAAAVSILGSAPEGQDHHDLLFDYYGFPAETYKLTWPVPEAPQVAARAGEVLEAAGIECDFVAGDRGLDHGVFIPLKLVFPDADVPVVQISLASSLDPEFHLALGAALAPLRAEGVAIVGSGMATHNMRARGISPTSDAAARMTAFSQWLTETVTDDALDAKERRSRLAAWEEAPGARTAHPREEHLIPLHVAAAAAGFDTASVVFEGEWSLFELSCFAWSTT